MSHAHIRQSRRHMATTVTLTLSVPMEEAETAGDILSKCHDRIAGIECELSEYIPTSPIFCLNEAGLFEPIGFSDCAWRCFESAQNLKEKTKGAFDPAIKSGVRSEGIFLWNSEAQTVWKTHEEAHLSFAAIGKGFALDEVRKILEEAGFFNYCLSAGGSSQIISGFAAPDWPWTFGWSWRKNNEGEDLGLQFDHHSGRQVALGVSGFHEKGDHILDPKTKKPLKRTYQSALIGHQSAAAADALSTALLVQGWKGNVAAGQHAAAVVDEKEVPFWNTFFEKWWGVPQCLILLFLFVSRLGMADEESFDLSTLGVDDFAPYSLERESIWILLPLMSLILVFVHLKKQKRKSRRRYE